MAALRAYRSVAARALSRTARRLSRADIFPPRRGSQGTTSPIFLEGRACPSVSIERGHSARQEYLSKFTAPGGGGGGGGGEVYKGACYRAWKPWWAREGKAAVVLGEVGTRAVREVQNPSVRNAHDAVVSSYEMSSQPIF